MQLVSLLLVQLSLPGERVLPVDAAMKDRKGAGDEYDENLKDERMRIAVKWVEENYPPK